MIIKNLQNNKAFVILFAVTLSSLLLAIALGISNIALQEVKFSTNARETNNAFFAADTGIESVLYGDRAGDICVSPCGPLEFIVPSGNGKSCAIVRLTKTATETTVISKGYNIGDSNCDSSNPDRIEREIKVTY